MSRYCDCNFFLQRGIQILFFGFSILTVFFSRRYIIKIYTGEMIAEMMMMMMMIIVIIIIQGLSTLSHSQK